MEKKPELRANAAPFVVKTYALLENPAYQSIVSWTPSGKSFAIHNTDEMANKVLPAYFKSQNLCSFIRQLNTYGFSKVDGPLRLEFMHENFHRGRPENMAAIMRRKSVKRETEDQHTEDRKVAAPAPTPTTTPRSPDGSENGGEPHRSPPFGEASPAAQVAAPATALLAEQNNQIAQIGSILQKILVELERVKREQSTLREAVAGIQQQQLQQQQQQQQPLLHATMSQPSHSPSIAPSLLTMAKVRSEPELLDVIADMHRTTLETEPSWEFDQPIPIDELLGEVLQLPQTPAANGPVHQQ